MFANVYGETTCGIDGVKINVEVDVANGLPAFDIVGLPTMSVREARERVKSALRNSDYPFPMTHITVNLAPADLKKEGSGLDLPIAIGILVSAKFIVYGLPIRGGWYLTPAASEGIWQLGDSLW